MKAMVKALLLVSLVTSAVLSAGLPFDPSRGLVEVEITLDGSVRGKFGIDTGADRLYVDEQFAKDNDLTFARFQPQRDVTGIDGSSPARTLSIKSSEIGDHTLRNLKGTTIDMGSVVTDQRAGVPDGLIGYDVLRQFYVSVDYPGKTIDLATEEPQFLAGKRFETVPYRTYRHLIIVDAVFNDDVTAPMLLDYCASVTVVSPYLAEQLDLSIEPNEIGFVSTIEIADDVSSDSVATVVADLTAFKRSTPRGEFEGILGATFLRTHRVTIDYTEKLIYFRR